MRTASKKDRKKKGSEKIFEERRFLETVQASRSQRGLILEPTMRGRYGLKSDKHAIADAFYERKVNPKVVPAENYNVARAPSHPS